VKVSIRNQLKLAVRHHTKHVEPVEIEPAPVSHMIKVVWPDEMEKAFDESKHPRVESGKGGGEFAPKGAGGGGSPEKSPDRTDSVYKKAHEEMKDFVSSHGIMTDDTESALKNATTDKERYEILLAAGKKMPKDHPKRKEFDALATRHRIRLFRARVGSETAVPVDVSPAPPVPTPAVTSDKPAPEKSPETAQADAPVDEVKQGKTYDSKKTNGRISRYKDGSIGLIVPYDGNFVVAAKKLGGKFSSYDKSWEFPKEKAEVAEKMFDQKYNDLNDESVASGARKQVASVEDTVKADVKQHAEDTSIAYDPSKKMGKMSVRAGRVYLSGDYDPKFVDAVKNIDGRVWSSEEKAWSVPVKSYDSAKTLFHKYYNDGNNKTISDKGHAAVAEAKNKERTEYEDKTNKEPATAAQKDYIATLLTRYISASGKNPDIKDFGEISKYKASGLIEALKGGEEQVSYMGLFERGGGGFGERYGDAEG
jgi:hypothetical protein